MLRGAVRARVQGHSVLELHDRWEAASTAPDAHADADSIDGLDWRPTVVPGTAADVLCAGGAPPWELSGADLDGKDWWFRTSVPAMECGSDEEAVVVFEGLATIAEVYLNGLRIHDGSSMFEAVGVDVSGALADGGELAICCRALTPRLAGGRRPRARWRTRLIADGALRFYRTMLIGRTPGFAPGPPVVGPWRPVRLEHRRVLAVDELDLRPRVEGGAGVLAVRLALRPLGVVPTRVVVELDGGERGRHEAELELTGTQACGELTVPDVALWWPHTHGEPALYGVSLRVESDGETRIDAGRVGFRVLEAGGESLERDGLSLVVNGEPLFVRGAVWTALAASGMAARAPGSLGAILAMMCEAGMNMVRIPGVGAYESAEFHDLCDELGILVWQDFMFANLDYPQSDAAFLEAVRREARQQLAMLGGRPSLAVLCGSSEVAQQVAMLGLDASLAGGPLYDELLPDLIAEARVDALYVPSAPWGGDLPFRPDRGVANYYGVGAYRRPLLDARLSGVRFATECLAFANVPEAGSLAELGNPPPVNDPRWKAGVPRDQGSAWDFDDVRDHYLSEIFGVDAAELRASDGERYLELSRELTGIVMAETLGEWRRGASPCAGAIIQWLRDLRPGAGWGILDHRGEPKVAYHHVRRALAPLAVWSTDEGLSGISVHVANDTGAPVSARLRVALYADLERRVEEASRELELAPHSNLELGVEELLGRFVDASWSYRFGPPGHDVVAVTLHAPDGGVLSQSFRFPAGRPLVREPGERLGLTASISETAGDRALLVVAADRLAHGVRVNVAGFRASDDAFSVEPGGGRNIELTRLEGAPGQAAGTLTALNLAGRVPIELLGTGDRSRDTR